MRSASVFTLSVGLLLLCSTSWAQQARPDFSVADKYFAKYIKGDIEPLESMMGEDIRFEDSASAFDGREATLEGLKGVFKSITMGEFSEQSRFHSGNIAVYVGKLQFTYKGDALGFPGASFEFDTAFIVTLTLDGEKVNKHIDYVDTDAFMSQFNEQAAELRKKR